MEPLKLDYNDLKKLHNRLVYIGNEMYLVNVVTQETFINLIQVDRKGMITTHNQAGLNHLGNVFLVSKRREMPLPVRLRLLLEPIDWLEWYGEGDISNGFEEGIITAKARKEYKEDHTV